MDVLYFVNKLHESTLRTLVLLCLSPAYPPSLAQRTVCMVQNAAMAGRVAPELYLSFLASLLLGQSSQVGAGLLDCSYTRAKEVVSTASRALHSFPGGSGMPVLHNPCKSLSILSNVDVRIPFGD